ncbi:MAG TPA: STAS domain-containing protein [Fimbriimonadaceae bacterium]|nr:STAS domain-containing protein [Fimbriimonadaceae bacterium]
MARKKVNKADLSKPLTITLSGILDIFEATTLYSDAMVALNQPGVDRVHVDLRQVQRLDVTAYQTLRSLRRTAEASGVAVSIDVEPPLAAELARSGMAL